jgi:hypothetical protein
VSLSAGGVLREEQVPSVVEPQLRSRDLRGDRGAVARRGQSIEPPGSNKGGTADRAEPVEDIVTAAGLELHPLAWGHPASSLGRHALCHRFGQLPIGIVGSEPLGARTGVEDRHEARRSLGRLEVAQRVQRERRASRSSRGRSQQRKVLEAPWSSDDHLLGENPPEAEPKEAKAAPIEGIGQSQGVSSQVGHRIGLVGHTRSPDAALIEAHDIEATSQDLEQRSDVDEHRPGAIAEGQWGPAPDRSKARSSPLTCANRIAGGSSPTWRAGATTYRVRDEPRGSFVTSATEPSPGSIFRRILPP